MNDSKTPKIVVGVGLVAAYSAIAFYLMRDKPVVTVAQDEATAQVAGAPIPAPAIAPSLTDDLSAGVDEQPAIATDAPVPAVPAPVAASPAASAPAVPSPAARATARSAAAPAPRTAPTAPRAPASEETAREEATVTEETGISAASDAAPASTAGDISSPTVAIADAGDESAAPAGETPISPPAAAAPSSATDGQITTDVKTQIAAVAPASTINVTTTDGVVELSGSVPSQEAIEKVTQAARTVAHVRAVDSSALMVSNQ